MLSQACHLGLQAHQQPETQVKECRFTNNINMMKSVCYLCVLVLYALSMTKERPEEPLIPRDIPLSGTESYVVRIYRRGKRNSPDLVGLVQSVETQDERPFTSLDELMDIFRK